MPSLSLTWVETVIFGQVSAVFFPSIPGLHMIGGTEVYNLLNFFSKTARPSGTCLAEPSGNVVEAMSS